MYFWNAQWQLDVDITNVSAAYGAVNIAGPQSRELMALLTSNIALDSEAFPYMAARTGSVAGIPRASCASASLASLAMKCTYPSASARGYGTPFCKPASSSV